MELPVPSRVSRSDELDELTDGERALKDVIKALHDDSSIRNVRIIHSKFSTLRNMLESEQDLYLDGVRHEEEDGHDVSAALSLLDRYDAQVRTLLRLPLPVRRYSGYTIDRTVESDASRQRLESVLRDIASERKMLIELQKEQSDDDYEVDLSHELDNREHQPIYAGEKLEDLHQFEAFVLGLLDPTPRKPNLARRTGPPVMPVMSPAGDHAELCRKLRVYQVENGRELATNPRPDEGPWETAARFMETHLRPRKPVPLPVPPNLYDIDPVPMDDD